MTNPITAFLGSLMEPSGHTEKEALKHLVNVQERAEWRIQDDLIAHRAKGFHKHPNLTDPEGYSAVPRQYSVASHSHDRNQATYAANSYSSAIAITELYLKKREY